MNRAKETKRILKSTIFLFLRDAPTKSIRPITYNRGGKGVDDKRTKSNPKIRKRYMPIVKHLLLEVFGINIEITKSEKPRKNDCPDAQNQRIG
jgi:hypothetical protein